MNDVGLVVHMLIEKRLSFCKRKYRCKLLKLKLESEDDSTIALELINLSRKFYQKLAIGNLDSPLFLVEELSILEQTATGIGTSNQLMVCFILNTKDYLTKFDPKLYEGVFLGYSENSKAYIILNKHTRNVEESLNVTLDETPPPTKTSLLVDDDLDEEEAIKVTAKKNLENDIVDETLEIDEIVNIKESRNHPLENVIGNLNQRTLRSQAQNQSNFFCFISTIEPKNVNEAFGDESWIVAMQEQLNQFVANDVWELLPQPRNMTIIGTKWVFRNMLDDNGIVSQNKVRLVAQGYNQQKGIDYDETYAPVARLDSIRILLAYACALDFKLFQMDVKSTFLNGFINEEVYVAQPPGFIDFEKLDHVYKLKKAKRANWEEWK
ncbi:retrovirus-related pol polyprotein from transposon TNT 1-94 [Tanacetum coccineum]